MSASTANHWPKVTPERPCPKCSKTNRCLLAPDGKAGICWRSGSQETWHDQSHRSNGNSQYHRPDPPPSKPPQTFISADQAIRQAGIWAEVPAGWALTKYEYARGGEVYAIIARWDDPAGLAQKIVRPVHRVANGWGVGDPPKWWPYRIDEAVDAQTIYIVEGEKCVDHAAELGLIAITSSHGSKSPQKTDWSDCNGKQAVIFPDNDPPGEKYAAAVSEMLSGMGCRVKIVRLPDLPPGGDIVDFDQQIGSGSEATREAIERLIRSTPRPGLILTPLATVARKPIEWLWPGRLPMGKISIFFGDPDCGKSTAATYVAGRVSTGGEWPDGSGNAPTGTVFVMTLEDGIADTFAHRADAAQADSQKIIVLSGVRFLEGNGKLTERVFTLDMVEHLRDAIDGYPDVKLVVIDPPASCIPDGVNENSNAGVRGLLAPWAKMAEEKNLCVLFIMHRPKAGTAKSVHGALGSLAWLAAARAAWMFAKDKDDPNRRLFLRAKCNLAAPVPNLAYRIEGPVAHTVWEGTVDISADDVSRSEADPRRPGPDPKKLEAATEWLEAELASFEPVSVETLKKNAEAAAVSWRTIQRASVKLGVEPARCQFGGGYTWRLPRP